MLKGENMIRSRWIAIVWAVVLFLGLPAACRKSAPNTKIGDRFEVSFGSAKYAGSTSTVHSSEGRGKAATERLRLYCEVGILDPNLVLGISRQGIITQFTNGKGDIIHVVDQALPRRPSMRYRYEAPRYRRRFVAPVKPAKWKTVIWSVLRLPPKRSRPQWIDELQPSRMTLELDPGLPGPDCEKISRVKGHFYVLMAESLEHIDIPFEPNEEWVRLTPDLEIKVLEAQSAESQYNYRIETRKGERTSRTLSPGSDLPSRFAVNQQLLGQDGKPTRHHRFPFLPSSVGGSGRGSGSSVGTIEKIRFVIAVKPSHHKIPFELEDIPLPCPTCSCSYSTLIHGCTTTLLNIAAYPGLVLLWASNLNHVRISAGTSIMC
jgi:hypothetical protein